MNFNFPEIEQKILKFWKKNKIFEKLRKKNQGKKPWSFLDGPITANNPMGVHHAWGRTYKDVFQRYKAMQGCDQRFQNGFDCQGLWVEVEVEKELGFKNKKDIEKYGIEKFSQKCQERVLKYSKIQTEQSIRLGQWMDWKNSYYTMSDENNYAIWHFLKECHQKGLLYKGHDVVPWCWRCGTAISQHEILTEEYQEVVHRAIFFKLPVLGQKKTFLLAWTTTPWTLPANVALAVHPDLLYVKVQDKEDNVFILLKDRADLIPQGEIIGVCKGKDLKGLKYQGLFDELAQVKKALKNYQHSVILWEEVTTEEGTGIVHIAPGCGQEDFQLAKKFRLPVIDPTDDESRYQEGFEGLSGKFVFEKKTGDLISENLKEKGLVFKIEDYRHRYPVCWRCKEELIFRLVDEWYIAMDSLRKPLMEIAHKIKWIPSFGLDRELDWLKNMQDWLISKKRYWGLALPIYECEKCGNFEVIGSKKELRKRAVKGWEEFKGHTPHRPWVDEVKIKCQKCDQIVSRIPDVGNPWLDAGIVPFSTTGYFKDKNFWKKWFPADFICESFPGQFKNWFYSLLVMSQVLENTEPFKTIFGFASVVDEKGEEMHKSKGNVIWFDEAIEKIGADVMRWLYVKQNPVYNMRFGYKVAGEAQRKLLTLANSYAFFETYRTDKTDKTDKTDRTYQSDHPLDKWIISRLNGLIGQVTENMDKYDTARASAAIEHFFVEDLSLWYIRRSRKRFHPPNFSSETWAGKAPKKDFQEASATLYYVLLRLAKVLAPMLPFFAEEVYQKLKKGRMPESVHLCDWPKADKRLLAETLEEKMVRVREIVAKALAKRTKLGVRVRQPLQKLKAQSSKLKADKELLDLIKEEVNVKEVIFDPEIAEEIELDTAITPELKEEGQVREVIRHIQDLRKQAGLIPKDKVEVYYSGARALEKVLAKNKGVIARETNSQEVRVIPAGKQILAQEKEIKIAEHLLWLGIKKVK